MKIRIAETGTFPAPNLINTVVVEAGVYPVIRTETTLDNAFTYYIIENQSGYDAQVLDKYCTVVPEYSPMMTHALSMYEASRAWVEKAASEPGLTVTVRESDSYRQTDMFQEDVFLKKGSTFDVLQVLRETDYTQYTVEVSSGVFVHLYADEVNVRPKNVQKYTSTENRRYMYVLVRADMEIENILVQSTHAAYESGLEFKNNADRTTIIVLQVKDVYKLHEAYKDLQRAGIQCTIYQEQTLGLGYTAIGTEALTADQRHLLKKYKLLKVKA